MTFSRFLPPKYLSLLPTEESNVRNVSPPHNVLPRSKKTEIGTDSIHGGRDIWLRKSPNGCKKHITNIGIDEGIGETAERADTHKNWRLGHSILANEHRRKGEDRGGGENVEKGTCTSKKKIGAKKVFNEREITEYLFTRVIATSPPV